MATIERGHVFLRRSAAGDATVLVVSPDERNAFYPNVIAVLVNTIVDVQGLPHSVPLGDGEPISGVVLADLVFLVSVDDLTNDYGPVSAGALRQVDAALAGALGLT